MDMALAIPRYTLADLDAFPDDGNRYELLDGLLLVTPAPSLTHQHVVATLVRLLTVYLDSSVASVYSPGSVEVEPNVHLEPDLLIVPRTEPITKKWTGIRNWWLAIEVSGRGSRVYDRDFKHAAYTSIGVRDVWRVDLRERCITVSSHGNEETEAYEDQFIWHPPELSTPLVIDVPSIFAGVETDH